MSITFNIIEALESLSSNKLRSILTVLGIVIGVAAVISLLAVGNGATASITSQIESIGTNLIFISPGNFQQGGVASAAGSAATFNHQRRHGTLTTDRRGWGGASHRKPCPGRLPGAEHEHPRGGHHTCLPDHEQSDTGAGQLF